METDVNGLEILQRTESLALLGSRRFGRLVYTRHALPAVIPVNYAVRDSVILIWTGSASSLGQAVRGAVVALQTDDIDEAAHTGWSVTVTGTAVLVTDPAEREVARRDGPVPWAPGVKDYLIRIPITVITGRRLPG